MSLRYKTRPLPVCVLASLACYTGFSCAAQITATAEAASRAKLAPDAAFVQWGSNTGAKTATVGLIWDGRNVWLPFGTTRLSYYTELSLGHWRAEGASGSKHSSHAEFGLTPTLRLEPLNSFGLFAELGIGAHLITPNYRRSNKRFSTAFNFGDHIGIGVRPESWKGAEISLRFQHFSNAGIKQPNPGENFLQLRIRLPL